MHIEEVPLPKIYIDAFKKEGIENLYPAQIKSIDPIFSGRNLVVSIPTASGKTLIAYIAILRAKTLGMRAVYIVPLRALAREKYEELSKFPNLKVVLGIGDYDIFPRELENCDVLVATSEKMDSILRHRPEFASEIGVVVADEIHLIDSFERGPTLEAALTKIRLVNPQAQIIALSATISNIKEIGKWLDAVCIYDEWRPVQLKCGVYYEDYVLFDDDTSWNIRRDNVVFGNLVLYAIKDGGQILIFVSRRKEAESLAEKIANKIHKTLYEENLKVLENIDIPSEPDIKTYWDKIAELVKKGCCFHHAGLSNEQRNFVEDLFKKGIIKCLVATTTLAAGINLPARYVIIKDVYRFDGKHCKRIPAIEVKQMLGRAGRPKYDNVGYGIIVAPNEERAEEYMEYYIKSPPEEILSKMGEDRALRFHTLALIASNFCKNLDEICKFYRKTFYGFQNEIERGRIKNIVDFLLENGLVEKKGKELNVTEFGRIVSVLYIDPETGIIFRDTLDYISTPFSVLLVISITPDMNQFYVFNDELKFLTEQYNRLSSEISNNIAREISEEALKTALVLYEWIEESSLDSICERYNVGPGDVYSRVEIAEWLLYSFEQIAKAFNSGNVRMIEVMKKRVKYGVKEDIIELMKINGIGRVRGRRLKDWGFDIEKLRTARKEELIKIPGIGDKIAENIIKYFSRYDDGKR